MYFLICAKYNCVNLLQVRNYALRKSHVNFRWGKRARFKGDIFSFIDFFRLRNDALGGLKRLSNHFL